MKRAVPPPAADELSLLRAFLDFQRATLRWKAHGVSDTDARRALLPTSRLLTLAGLIRHLTAVERGWFRIVLGGESIRDLGGGDDPKAMRVSDSDRLSDLIAAYEVECAEADKVIASMDLDDVARMPGHAETLRWVMLHMIEETARHNGHADLLRESIDGATGE